MTAPILDVFIAGTPVPRPSSRQWRRQPGLRAWYDAVAWTVKAARVGMAPLSEPLELWISFRIAGQGDGSNFFKAVEDALIGVLYVDDRQVRADLWEQTWEARQRLADALDAALRGGT